MDEHAGRPSSWISRSTSRPAYAVRSTSTRGRREAAHRRRIDPVQLLDHCPRRARRPDRCRARHSEPRGQEGEIRVLPDRQPPLEPRARHLLQRRGPAPPCAWERRRAASGLPGSCPAPRPHRGTRSAGIAGRSPFAVPRRHLRHRAHLPEVDPLPRQRRRRRGTAGGEGEEGGEEKKAAADESSHEGGS